ncbi:TrbC/VirB2 family protein [Campylobacter devanensis]|uniref:TrbC/VirB2 family protein n=1 Tax=Campylobacter devanensis TaxID=3161138 RepID=UPI000A34F3E3|nr:TrbC/VirB2 family protein [Campylobacter sp. P160]
MERERESRKNLNKASVLTLTSNSKSNLTKLFNSLFAIFLIPTLSFGAGGLDSAENLLDTVSGWLTALSAVTVTIAILIVGYKITFGGQTIRECTPIIIGAVLIASASSIAGLLLGSN